ncbi:MAG: RNA-directed DNA polymerase [Muribaculaceae bacterium]|nr:RNA-directed DNA polymerase [Muribaculaceae bacterium]
MDLDNLVLAAHKAFRHKALAGEVRRYRANLLPNLMELQSAMLDGSVKTGNYREFIIREPKERKISAAPIEQRIMHHAIMNVCHDIFDSQLIYDSFATRPGKGTHCAVWRLRDKMKGYRYYAKLDFRKYFDSIDHDVLRIQLRHIIKDERMLELFDRIIESHGNEGRGVPIGNLTSQYFANYYLSGLDHYMKEVVRANFYIRYMDDVVILDNDRDRLKEMVRHYEAFSAERLKLCIKPPIIGRTCHGVPFLGYRVFSDRILLNGKGKRRFRRNMLKLDKLFDKGSISEEEYASRLGSYVAHACFADSERFRRRVLYGRMPG